MLSQSEHVLAAVSGGADSIALLYGLLEIKEAFSLSISVCHINHNLRGEESDKDQEFVKNLCEELKLPLFCFSVDVPKQGMSLEEAARKVRYDHFYKCGIKKIALGHNLNDNAETLLLRLCRGTGLTGLSGIPAVRKDGEFTLIRPLLETNRKEIEDYLQVKGVNYRSDESNFDTAFSRNRIRHEVLPILEKINPQAVTNLAKSAELLRNDSNFLATLTGQSNRIHIPTMQRHSIHRALSQVKGLKDITQKHIAQVESLLTSQSGKELYLPGGFKVCREYDYLLIINKNESEIIGFSLDISFERSLIIPSTGQSVQFSVKYKMNTSSANFHERCTKYFNYDKIEPASLKVRNRRPGDVIYISGLGHKKLSDEFTDRKIPKSLRDEIPLLAHGKDILWIMDNNGRINDAYKPEAEKPILVVEVSNEREH